MFFMIVATALRLVALIWAIRVALRMKDWKAWMLPLLFGLLAAPSALRVINEQLTGPLIPRFNWPVATVVISLGAVAAMYFLDRSITSAQRAEQRLVQLNKELDLRVRERTSELQRANQALEDELGKRKKAEGRFRELLESAPDSMVIVDQSGNIVLVNAQTENLFGYARSELIGQPVEVLVPDRSRRGHSRYLAEYFSDPQVRNMSIATELFGRRKDGSEFPAEISLSPIRTEEGTLVASAIRDITERKQAQDALRQSEERFRLAFEDAPIGTAIVGSDYRLRKVNKTLCEMLGYIPSKSCLNVASRTSHTRKISTRTWS